MQHAYSKLVVFISGTFISHYCWDEWIIYFESQGYKCIAPSWPHKDAAAEELRNRPVNDPMALNTIVSLTEYYTAIINLLPEKPIIIGHSLGGLLVQLLLQKGLGAAGISIHSFPPRGVSRFRYPFLKAVWSTMMLLTPGWKIYMMSFRKWKYTIANGLNCDQQKESYYKYAIPESKNIVRDTFRCKTTIDFNKPHAPLLFTAGSQDKLVPASLNYRNYQKYKRSNTLTDYTEFQGHTHLVFGQPSWKKEADFILNWLQGITIDNQLKNLL